MWIRLGTILLAASMASGCALGSRLGSRQGPGEERTSWHIDPAYAVSPDSSTVHLLVATSHCGDHDPSVRADVSYGRSHIVIATIVKLESCLTGPGDIPFVLELAEPVGGRELVDPHVPDRLGTPPTLPTTPTPGP